MGGDLGIPGRWGLVGGGLGWDWGGVESYLPLAAEGGAAAGWRGGFHGWGANSKEQEIAKGCGGQGHGSGSPNSPTPIIFTPQSFPRGFSPESLSFPICTMGATYPRGLVREFNDIISVKC